MNLLKQRYFIILEVLKTIFLKVDLTVLNKTHICRILPYFFSAVIIVIQTVSLHFRRYLTINFVLFDTICQIKTFTIYKYGKSKIEPTIGRFDSSLNVLQRQNGSAIVYLRMSACLNSGQVAQIVDKRYIFHRNFDRIVLKY